MVNEYDSRFMHRDKLYRHSVEKKQKAQKEMKTYPHPDLDTKLIKQIILNEGGSKYTNRPNDKGKGTKYGISDMSDGVENGLVILADGTKKKVIDLTEADAIGIYSKRYYSPLHPELLQSEALILNLFDWAVTSGVELVVKKLQRILGVEEDGDLGPITAEKANSYSGDLISVFKEKRIAFYNMLADSDVEQYKKGHPDASMSELIKFTNEGNRKGWINRVKTLKLQ